MPWKCELVGSKELDEKFEKGERIPIGWMWFQRPENVAEELLGNFYKENNQANRLPLLIELPDGPWCMDGLASGDSTKAGWAVTGEPPAITVYPSINSQAGYRQGYHGFLTAGVLSDDLEGRTYKE
jgi:hypothetical protein